MMPARILSACLISAAAAVMLSVQQPAPEADSPYSTEFLLGRFDPAGNPDFSLIPTAYTSKSGIFMKSAALQDFIRMYDAALKDGHRLSIISATRNFDYQKQIWERKWNDGKFAHLKGPARAREILTYSAMPGTSRHHWGTDIDINSVNPADFDTGSQQKVYQWLCTHAAGYGFYQTYTTKSHGRTGYEEEKWHWSHTEARSILSAYNAKIGHTAITGFSGSEYAAEIDVIGLYVNGIDSAMKLP
jgi:LAS superfamily LD-carboxypeptidase LdcB